MSVRPQTRLYTPKPSNVGEPQSVRDAYQRQWEAEKVEREAQRQQAEAQR
ncbi:hypothetical protein [Microbispora sp. H10949]|nr:hypothetical protein [Microbispora sp. H10949]